MLRAAVLFLAFCAPAFGQSLPVPDFTKPAAFHPVDPSFYVAFSKQSHRPNLRWRGKAVPGTQPDLIWVYSEAANGTGLELEPIGTPVWYFPGTAPGVGGVDDGDCHQSYGGGAHGTCHGNNPLVASWITYFTMDGYNIDGTYTWCSFEIQYYYVPGNCSIDITAQNYVPPPPWGVTGKCGNTSPNGKSPGIIHQANCNVTPEIGLTVGPLN